ncbi:MAG: CPXCG motif-containing cysteine-rich protein [Planctomycetes bacterium]|nr:CPXCG motif-containing cysteine-rich protein [Planctomycetota bacterium]
MIARATKGRQLTPRVMGKILRALNLATGESYELADLFDYAPRPGSRLEQRMPEECATSTDREASYTCPNCGETIVVPVDIDARIQEYVEDCPVCCSPVLLRLEISEDGDVRIAAQAE